MLILYLLLLYVTSSGLLKKYYYSSCSDSTPLPYTEYHPNNACIVSKYGGSHYIQCLETQYIEYRCISDDCSGYQKCVENKFDLGCVNNGTTELICNVEEPRLEKYGFYFDGYNDKYCTTEVVNRKYYHKGGSCDVEVGEKLICLDGKMWFGFFENLDCTGELVKKYEYVQDCNSAFKYECPN